MSDASSGIASVAEPKPSPAPLPRSVTVLRANEPTAGITGSAGGSAASITSTADAPPDAPESPSVNDGLPESGGSSATGAGTAPPLPARPTPVTTGTISASE